ncbi:hypothetical protein C8R44DRAFT_732778 [Mycena epipterygia]|nr:hypothetical protein C8R44DRAFT_732778 [Mycena epipterygia]
MIKWLSVRFGLHSILIVRFSLGEVSRAILWQQKGTPFLGDPSSGGGDDPLGIRAPPVNPERISCLHHLLSFRLKLSSCARRGPTIRCPSPPSLRSGGPPSRGVSARRDDTADTRSYPELGHAALALTPRQRGRRYRQRWAGIGRRFVGRAWAMDGGRGAARMGEEREGCG